MGSGVLAALARPCCYTTWRCHQLQHTVQHHTWAHGCVPCICRLFDRCNDVRVLCRTYGFLFEWLYPAHMTTLLACLNAWSDVPTVTTPLLKFMAELAFNKSQRITFDAISPSGILLFRRACMHAWEQHGCSNGDRLRNQPKPPGALCRRRLPLPFLALGREQGAACSVWHGVGYQPAAQLAWLLAAGSRACMQACSDWPCGRWSFCRATYMAWIGTWLWNDGAGLCLWLQGGVQGGGGVWQPAPLLPSTGKHP